MRQRAISAVIFVIAMLAGVFGGSASFFLLFSTIAIGCLWELNSILFRIEITYNSYRRASGLLVGYLPMLVAGLNQYTDLKILPWAAFCILLPIFLLFAVELLLESEQPFGNISRTLLGFFYVGIPFAVLVSIAHWNGEYAPWQVLGLLMLNWTNDTMAYVTGSMIGRRPFFSRISPKKTWEGTLGGMAFTLLAAYGLHFLIDDFSLAQWMALAVCVAIFGTLGDLIESMLKRSAKIKDSGTILPGHGGFLDRFDSFIFVLPFTWLALLLLQG